MKRPGQKPSPSKELRGRPSKKPRDFCRVAFISHPKILVIFTQHRENKIDGVNPIAGQASKTSAKWLRLLTIMSGLTSGCFSSEGRNFPVRTSTPVRKDLFSYLRQIIPWNKSNYSRAFHSGFQGPCLEGCFRNSRESTTPFAGFFLGAYQGQSTPVGTRKIEFLHFFH